MEATQLLWSGALTADFIIGTVLETAIVSPTVMTKTAHTQNPDIGSTPSALYPKR
jgi:hypothetical protein